MGGGSFDGVYIYGNDYCNELQDVVGMGCVEMRRDVKTPSPPSCRVPTETERARFYLKNEMGGNTLDCLCLSFS